MAGFKPVSASNDLLQVFEKKTKEMMHNAPKSRWVMQNFWK